MFGANSDWDQDGLSDLSEYLAGTVPTNAASLLRFSAVSMSPGGVVLSWDSASARYYSVERSTNLAAGFVPLVMSLAATAATNTWTDAAPSGGGPTFYRVRLGP